MSFATEMATYKATPGKSTAATSTAEPVASAAPPEAAAPVKAAETPAQATEPVPHMPKHGEIFDESMFNEGLPVGAAPVEPVAAKAPEAPKAGEAIKLEEPKKAPIKIGTQEFQTIDEAVEYAKSLEAAAAQDKAYIEGLKDGKVKEAPPVPKTAYEVFSEKVFENPVEAAKEFSESIKREIREEYNSSLEIQARTKLAADTKAAAWDAFYKANSDISSPEHRDILENYLLPKLAKEGKIKPEDSDTKFAELARKHLRIMKEATQPAVELPKGPVPMLGATGEATTQATTEKKEEIIDMVTALNKLRRRKA